MSILKILKQIGVVFLISITGQLVAELLPVEFPGSVMSMILMFLLFVFNWIKPDKLKEVNGFLLENMAFFFIPSGVGIITQFSVIKNSVFEIILICIISSIVTFAVTAYTVKLVMKIQDKLRNKKSLGGAD